MTSFWSYKLIIMSSFYCEKLDINMFFNWENSNLSTMKQCRKCTINKDLKEFSKQSKSKDGLASQCKLCFNAYFQANRDKYKERYNRWRSENLDRARELERKNFQNPTRKHKHKINQAFRRVIMQKATFKKYEAEIKAIYDACPVGYHVDHIIPLRAKNMCGLHVPWNLQYLPALENIRKNNKVILDKDEES